MSTEPTAEPLEHDDWTVPAGGLSTIAIAMMWRLAIAIGAAVLLVLAVTQRSYSMVKFVSLVAPVATMLITLAFVDGMFRFARQPDTSPGKGLATFAAVEMLVALLLDVFSYIKAVQIHLADRSSWSAIAKAREAAETAQTVSMWAMGLGFCAVFVMLGSFTAVSKHINRQDIADQVVNVGCMLVLAGAGALSFRWYIHSRAANLSIESLFLLGAVLLAFVTAAVVMYISLVRNLEGALRAHAGMPAELPAARVVER